MYKELVFWYCSIALILVAATEAKGGRRGGGSGGRSGSTSGRSSRGGGFFSRSSGGSKSSSIGGGWFRGFFHSSPYPYTYRPRFIIHSSSSHTGSYYSSRRDEEEAETAVGYSISKALNNDFFSIFNVVHDISKYPDKIRNKELRTTTTPSPSYTSTSTPYPLVHNYYNISDLIKDVLKDFDFHETKFDANPNYIDFGLHFREIQKNLSDMLASKAGNNLEVAPTERPSMKIIETTCCA